MIDCTKLKNSSRKEDGSGAPEESQSSKVLMGVQDFRIKLPSQRRGEEKGGQIPKKEENAKPLASCEEKGQEWAKHCQCGKVVQNQENKPANNEQLKKLEEDLPRLKESESGKNLQDKDGSRL